MDINQKTAQKLRETAARLIKQAEELEAGIDRSKCIYMTDTGKPKFENYPCKGNAITCSHPEIGEQASQVMTTTKCNPANCKYFKAVSNQPSANSSEPLEVGREPLEVPPLSIFDVECSMLDVRRSAPRPQINKNIEADVSVPA